jgi:transcriptional regulator with XRE-family HTH domain
MKIKNNLKLFRDALGFTQETVSSFLGEKISRGALANYEAGTREPPLDVLLKLADLYGVELSDFYEEDKDKLQDALLFAFRMEDVAESDLEVIANFKEVVKSYLKMNTIAQE